MRRSPMLFKETETLELKKSTSELKEAIISISAMLNKHGQGEVIFGIEDSGKVVGQTIGKMTMTEISKSIQDHMEPEIFPSIKEEAIEGQSCIRVKTSGNDMPYFAYGRAYTRVGDANRVLSSKELQELYLHKNKEALHWDDKPCHDAKLSDIDPGKLGVFLKKANLEFVSTDVALHNLGLMLSPSGALTNTAVLLFGRAPQKFMQNAQLRCAVFTNAYTIIDMKDYEGDLFSLIEEAQSYILKNIHTGERLEGLYRADVPEIDPEAFREAVINAFCHRDYYNSQEVQVAIFPDRLEIRSPGLLYGNLTIASIRKGGVSSRRNPLIAQMLHRIHFIEKWGRGIPKILSKEPTATFKEVGRQFITVFKRKEATQEKVSETTDEDKLKSTRKVSEKYLKLLEVIRTNPTISRKKLAQTLNEPASTILSRLRKLKKDGVLKHVGPARGGKWEVKGR
ncbi:MAG: putative DNA binding domain-containing protein [Candidatus Micrarchaeota archaeon]|nr:putative DNA binding domain-containing protein [Candidatus Micrarchaeota archaeon]